jgi:hypothetical protein
MSPRHVAPSASSVHCADRRARAARDGRRPCVRQRTACLRDRYTARRMRACGAMPSRAPPEKAANKAQQQSGTRLDMSRSGGRGMGGMLTAAARSGFQRERYGHRREFGGALPCTAAIAPANHRVAHDAARAHERTLNNTSVGIRFDATSKAQYNVPLSFYIYPPYSKNKAINQLVAVRKEQNKTRDLSGAHIYLLEGSCGEGRNRASEVVVRQVPGTREPKQPSTNGIQSRTRFELKRKRN